ncbi:MULTISPECIES: class I SAM-dependent methyltransferase [Vagococcus]|uniref:Methyltransferase n=1 Tax=Vagococcus fluvialis bH819 TaxID=1255619 RepID=A0A1X6WJZ7_9ENTE|nr:MULTISPECIES: class I SAM-dependent methyltransferase [Vagococcus]SLM84631.1 Methyltransferase [Vagococcus fluvialis bH819]HCM89905.1 class I SAM-dependent methyltransferase [Vagococcus sp.]
MASYETFAKIYDEVMDENLYLDWLEFTCRHLEKRQQKVLELACGTGILSVELANLGFNVCGLDLSEDMITLAKKRITSDDEKLSFKTGDMLDLDEKNSYDVVTCYSDSICYMPDKKAVGQVFSGVYNSLKENGTFIFDVHSTFQMEESFSEYSYHYQTDEFAFLWESYPGDHEYSVEHFLTFFVSDKKGKFERFDELHEERTYDISTYKTLIKDAGFKSVEVYADFEDVAPSEESNRWFFVCQK